MADIELFDDEAGPSDDPQDDTDKVANILASAFEATKIIEVVETQVSVGQIHFMCRIHPKNEKDVVHSICRPMLIDTKGKCDVFFGKQYILSKDNEVRYAWVISIGSDNLDQACKIICGIIERILPKSDKEITVPILGGAAPQGSVKSGCRGASPTPFGG